MRFFKSFYALLLTTLVTATISSCAPAASNPPPLSAASDVLPPGRSMAGSYLAGRFAQKQQDWAVAQNYMGDVLDRDDTNTQLVQRTFLLSLGAGNYARAQELAEKIVAGGDHAELALIFLSCEALSRDDFKTAFNLLEKLPSEGFGQYTKPLLTTWALVGLGKKDAALKLLSDSTSPADPTYRLHAGMIEELSGNMNEAASHYKVAMANGLDLHTAIMVGNFFERYGRPEVTRTIYRNLDKIYPFSPFMSALASRDPHRVIRPNITRAADGAALALFDLTSLLYAKRAYDSALIYNSMVQLLDAKSPYAKMTQGDIAALHGRYGTAIEDYNQIDRESLIFWLARMRIAEVYEASGQLDLSINTLTTLSQDSASRTQALASLGDVYRRNNRFESAVDAYNQALAGALPTPDDWPIIYARGIANQRLNRSDTAEKDLLQALSFQPDNPMILNFIAYSWADRGVNLDKALQYAKQAAALRPHDGYILDSYGWILFRLEKYKDSIVLLEQAVEKLPNDATLLDHLGDAYWQVGRHNEAQYRWRHARDLSEDPAFKKVVQQKLQHGIVVPSQIDRQQAKL